MRNERHAFDPISFVFGLFFTGIGAAFAFGGLDTLEMSASAAVALVFLLVGGLLLAVVWRRSRREVSPAPEPDESPTTPLPAPRPEQ